MSKRDVLFFLGGFIIGSALTATAMKLYEKHKLETIDSTEWEMPTDDREDEQTEEFLGADLTQLYSEKAKENAQLEREELVKRLNQYKSKAIEDLSKVEIEEKAPLEHSDEDGASFDFDKEVEQKIVARDAIQEIDYEEVSDHGNNFTEEYTFFADGVLMKDADETIDEISHILPISITNKDLYAIFEKNGYEAYCLRDTTTDTDYIIEWSDDSYKELYGE